jgi:hypothetical protein
MKDETKDADNTKARPTQAQSRAVFRSFPNIQSGLETASTARREEDFTDAVVENEDVVVLEGPAHQRFLRGAEAVKTHGRGGVGENQETRAVGRDRPTRRAGRGTRRGGGEGGDTAAAALGDERGEDEEHIYQLPDDSDDHSYHSSDYDDVGKSPILPLF